MELTLLSYELNKPNINVMDRAARIGEVGSNCVFSNKNCEADLTSLLSLFVGH